MTHWFPLRLPERPEGGFKIGINTRMMDPGELVGVNREINYDALGKVLNCGGKGRHAENSGVH